MISGRGLIDFGVLASMFLNAAVLFTSPVEFYFPYIFIVLMFPIMLLRFRFPVKLGIYLLLPLLVTGILAVYVEDNTSFLFIKIFLNVTVSSLFFYYICCLYDFDIEYLWRLYLRGAVFVSYIAVLQFVSYKVGFELGYDYSWLLNKWGVIARGPGSIRLNSIFSEPSYYGSSMGPAFFVAAYSLIKREKKFLLPWQSCIIIITYYMTYSSVAIVGIFIVLFLLLINFGFLRYSIIALPVMIGGFLLLYNNVDEFRERLDGVSTAFTGEITSATQVHGSSFVQYNNYHIAKENFIRNPFFGTGLGSHKVAYQKYTLTAKFGGIYVFNQGDGNSMAIRLMSETGLFGLLFIFIFVFRFFVRKKDEDEDEIYWLISSSILVLILLQLFRQGNYTYNGFFLFMWMYFFNFSNYNATKSAKELEVDEDGAEVLAVEGVKEVE